MKHQYDWKQIANDLNSLLRLHTTPIGIQMIKNLEDLEKIPKLRKPDKMHSVCQMMGQAIHLGFTIAITEEHVAGNNCKGICGLGPQTDEWKAGQQFKGVWFETKQDATAHQEQIRYIPYGKYKALVASPLRSERIQPDVCMVLAKPAQMFILLSGYVRSDYTPLDCNFIGESSCSATWVKALNTGKPSLSLPCFAELRYGGYSPDELILGITPDDLIKAIEGVKELGKIGLRYPIPPYSAQSDILEGLAKSYDKI
ncbi:DUF169 domain-containing protein [Selenomonadales bacterium OttesenSCG-928-I06]|nr:DUF169 domain-containing protein [Selenomonadales bacterium OttesenSCG-928-I06]